MPRGRARPQTLFRRAPWRRNAAAARRSGGARDEFLVGNGANQPEPISRDFLKVFGGPNNGTWGYAASVDGFPSNFLANVQFPESGRYVLQVAGRSQGFHVDWIELFTGQCARCEVQITQPSLEAVRSDLVLANAIPNQVIADGVNDIFNLPTPLFMTPIMTQLPIR